MLKTLHDARDLILKLSDADSRNPAWQSAVEHLLQAAEHGGGWLEFARIAVMQALYPKTKRGL